MQTEEQRRAYQRAYYQTHKKEYQERAKRWRKNLSEEDREKLRERERTFYRKKMRSDFEFVIKCRQKALERYYRKKHEREMSSDSC